MKTNQILTFVVIALVCGGVAGFVSARLVESGSDQTDQTVIAIRQLQFQDGSGNHQFSLEFDDEHGPCLVLKDSTGRCMYDLPPSVKLRPLGDS